MTRQVEKEILFYWLTKLKKDIKNALKFYDK